MNILILEDDPNRVKSFREKLFNHSVTVTDDVNVCINHLKSDVKWDLFLMDHDLGGEQMVDSFSHRPTGYVVAKFLEENGEYKPKSIWVHSLNSIGARNIIRALRLTLTRHVPFLWVDDDLLSMVISETIQLNKDKNRDTTD